MTRIALTVNGEPVQAEVAPRTHLADFLREQLLLTGTHLGCEHGICGACTVEIDGEIARSCITYAVTCDGARVRTIESFDDDALMVSLRQAFTEAHALQCGYCTPGMLIAARDLVRRKQGLSRPQIRVEMSGNLCRCTGYAGIVDAIERVMTVMPAKAGIHATLGSRTDIGVDPRLRGDDVARDGTPNNSWLGPAPGPVAHSGAPAMAVAPTLPRPAPSPSRAALPRPARGAPIEVSVGELEEVGGASRITQSFVLAHPRDAVWQLMSDVQQVARCMPGLTLDGPPQAGKVSGRLEAKIGPIAASFAGEGTARQVEGEHRQIIDGRGSDRRSGSRTTGSVDYRLSAVAGDEGREATRVDVVLSYTLAGPLAQFGRSGLVRDLVRRIGEAFAQNLDAELRDPGGAQPITRIGGLSLLMQAVADRVRTWITRIFTRRR
jgi:carbon-monoxide dehydrogenase small subunit